MIGEMRRGYKVANETQTNVCAFFLLQNDRANVGKKYEAKGNISIARSVIVKLSELDDRIIRISMSDAERHTGPREQAVRTLPSIVN